MTDRPCLRPVIACGFAVISFAPALAQAPAIYDGDYVGPGTVAMGSDASCTATARAELRITTGYVSTVWGFGTHLEGPIDATGSFSIYAPNFWGGVKLTAKVDGPRITGTLINGRCALTFLLSRQ